MIFQKNNSLDIELNHSVVSAEYWSYVGNKSNQRWTWYCIERLSGLYLQERIESLYRK